MQEDSVDRWTLQHDYKELLDSFSGKYTLASILAVIVG